jgi:tetratricopeptide (TPR) repeat protein
VLPFQKIIAGSLAIALLGSNAHAYDEVKLDRIVPLVEKKVSPRLLKLDRDQKLWILNGRGDSLEMISLEGKPLVYLKPGSKPADFFKTPIDFGFLSNGSMLVLDGGLNRVAILGMPADGKTDAVKKWKKAKLVGSFPVKGASALAVSHDDIVAVGYEDQAYIDIYSADGVLLHHLFGSEKFPLKNITGLAFANDGVLWALEQSKGAVHRFGADRKWLGATEGFEGARGIAVDEYGYAYVTLANGKWRELSANGAITGTFGTKGRNVGELLAPSGVATPDGAHVWVSETGNARFQEFHTINRDKKDLLAPAPAAFVQVRFKRQSQRRADAGAVRKNGDLLLLDSDANRFEVVTPDGKTKPTTKKKGKGKGSSGFGHPVSVALDKQDQPWILDAKDCLIKLMTDAGDVSKTIGQRGKKEGSILNPTLLAVRPDGSFMLADRDGGRVQMLGPTGLFLFAVGKQGGKPGEFSSVTGIAANDETLAVLDGSRKSLMFYNAGGNFIADVANKEGKVSYWSDPVALASDADGRFYVLDRGAKRVRIFNRKGQFLADFTARGQKLVCGGDHSVYVLDDKAMQQYEVRFVPKAIQNLSVVDDDGQLGVSWDANGEATQYAVYRSSAGQHYGLLKKTPDTKLSDAAVTPGLSYSYAVAGLNEAGSEGPWTMSAPVKAPRRKDVSLISFESIVLNPVFTAAAKYYVTHPIGQITIVNNDDKTYRNIKLSLSLKKYGDFTTDVVVPELAAGEKKTVPVTMTFNNSVLELTENTPVQMDVRLAYFENNQEKSVSQNAPITLYSRNAISWEDRARVASFITQHDAPVVEFARAAVRDNIGYLKTAAVGKPLAKAALLYESINALGISYVPDPKTPFASASANPQILDYVQFPRETLRRKTGDCDDTTALLAALLTSIGVNVALVDMPGHIFLMADLEQSDPAQLGFPEERFVKFQDSYWLPIETTQLGHGFLSAWQIASSEVKAGAAKDQIHFIPVLEAMQKYEPVTLVDVDKDTPAFPSEKVKAVFPALLKQLQDERYQALLRDIKKKIKDDPADHMLVIQMGMIQAEGGRPDDAQKTFESMLKEDESLQVQSSAQNNLGNLAYIKGDYAGAAKAYGAAAKLTPDDGGVAVNQARAAWKQGDTEAAKKYLIQAKATLPQWRDFTSDLPSELLPK